MKLRRRRASEVPHKIKSFIDGVIAAPLENIDEPLTSFFWDFDKGDFHHWVDLFNHFDTFFEKYIKPRKDLQLKDDFLESDPPFPREAVLQILRVVRIILDNCTNKHFYSSYEHHLSSLLASTDADVVEACLQTLSSFLRKSIGKHIIRDASLNSKLFAFAQGWGGKDEGLGLVACALENVSDPVADELGSTLHFEFYENSAAEKSTQGLQIIHLPKIITYEKSDLELLRKLIEEYRVPSTLRFSLLTRLRFSRAFSSFTARQQYTCIRLHAFIVLVQACGDTDDLVSFFNTEPEFINELVTLLSYEDAVPEKIRILSLFSLVALSQDRSRQPTVLTAVTSGGHRGILSSLMQKAIDTVVSKSSKSSVLFAEALLSLVTVLVSSSSGCSAMREAGFIPTLLPLLKNTGPQHLHLVSTAVHVLEAFMDYSNPAAALFRDLGGLDDTISRLKIEVSHVENGTSVQMDSSTSSEPLYSEALVSYHRRSLMKALLRAISLGTYAPGTAARVYGSEESLLPQCLHTIFKKAKDFGGGMFSLAAVVMSDLIHKDPTCYSILEQAGLPSAFLDAIMDGVLCSAEAITCIPQCLDALCLGNNGLQAVKDRNALRCFVKIFTSRNYLRALTGDTPSSLSSGLDELMRHAASLRVHGVDMLIEILKAIEKLGSRPKAASSTMEASSVPMETDGESSKTENPEKLVDPSADTSLLNVESFLPDFVNNVARLLETVLQNSDTCRIFVEKKGIEAVLQLFILPLMPSSVSIGQSTSIAFKNFSPHHSASLARALCLFLREHLKSTNELLVSLGGMHLAQVEDSKRTKVSRCLSSLEGILSLCNSLSKGTTNLVSELGTSDADVLKDLGVAYREILWQVSIGCDSKADDKQSNETETEHVNVNSTDTVIAASDDDTSMPVVRYMNPVSVRNSSHPHWGLERDFVSVVRSGEGFSRRSRHGLARIRGGRTSRHLEALHIDPEASMGNTETSSSQDVKKKSPEVLIMENLNKLAATIRSFFTTLVKGFPSSNRRRAETGSLSTASKNIGTALAKIFLEALSFPGYTTGSGLDMLSVKCHYLGKVVDHMAALTFDSRRRVCYTVLDVILPVWNHPMFPSCNPGFITTIVTLVTHIYCGVGDAKRTTGGGSGGGNQRFMPPPDEATIATIVEMGFTRGRAEEALRRVEANSVEMAMEWLFTHADDPVQEDDELARALALSLGNSSETPKADNNTEKSTDGQTEVAEAKTPTPPIDDMLAATMKLFQSSDSLAFPLTDLLVTFCNRNKGAESQNELIVPKCISALLLILDNLLQSKPKISSDSKEGTEDVEEKSAPVNVDEEKGNKFEKIFGKSTGYLTVEEGSRVVNVACNIIKRHLPAMVMQAVLLLCARLTKTHTLALQFLENGGMIDLFSIPKTCFFPGYDTVASAIIRHLIEDPQTLQTAMELELDTTGGRTVVVLSKEKEKEKDKSKAQGVEIGASSVPENKCQDGQIKCGKAQKKVPANLTQVVDHLLEIVMKYPSLNPEGDCARSDNAMEVDGSAVSKGKMKVDDTRKESDSMSEKSADGLAKVAFVLKLLSDILLMYVHAVGIILKRDLEMHGGIVHHVMHQLLHPAIDKTTGSDEWRGKLSEKASWFLVVLCGRSSEGRRRVINVLVKALSSFATSASSSSKNSLLPDKRVLAFVDLVYSILSKNSSSSSAPGSGCSPDIAKGMIDGGMIPCLSSILQVLDLDHPDAPKVVNIILKALECLTRAANAVEQLALSDLVNKKKSVSLGTGSDDQMVNTPVNQISVSGQNSSQHEITATDDAEQHHEETHQDEGDHEQDLNQPEEQELRIEMDEMEDGVLRDSDQIEMTFHVESRGGGDNTGDEDDEMGDDGEDDEDDDEGDDEDEDIAEDGTALMSLADTDVEDHEETGLGDEYNDEMVDDEDDDYHENRVIEVRWREALDGVLGQPGADSGLIDIAAEPFEGVNVDDLFGLRRPIGFDRRRQQSRTSFERSGTDGNNGLQHPLLLRPSSQSSELGPMWSSGGGNSSRDLESLSGGGFDVAHFYMFDAPVLPFDHSTAFGDRAGGGAPSLADFSVCLESLRAPTRRGPGNGRWTDDGQPQAGGQAAAIAQAVEEHFMSQLSTITSLANDNQLGAEPADNDAQQTEVPHDENVNQTVENLEQTREGQASGPSPDVANNVPASHDNMEIGEGNGSVNEQEEMSAPDDEASNNMPNSGDLNADVVMNVAGGDPLPSVGAVDESLSEQNTHIDDGQTDQPDEIGATNIAQSANGIDPTFLEALPAELRAEVLASQQAQSAPPPVSAPAPTPANAEEIDPEFLAALPPDIQAEVLAQQRAQRLAHQAEGQPVDMDNASIIATFPADLREEVLLTSSEAVLSALPSPLLAEAQMLRDRAMSHYQARSLFGNSHRLNNRRNGLGFDRQTVIDRGVGVTIGRRASSAILESLKVKEVEGDPLLDPDALKALIRLLRLAQPLGKGLLQRLFLNLCAHSHTRAVLVFLLLGMIKVETEGPAGRLTTVNSQRLYGCLSNVVYGRSQLLDGLPPLVLRRVLEILTYLATNNSYVATLLFHFDSSLVPESFNLKYHDKKNDKGKEKVVVEGDISHPVGFEGNIPILLFVKLLNQPLFLRSIAHLEQVMGLLQVVVYNAASKLESQSHTEQAATSSQVPPGNESDSNPPGDSSSAGGAEPSHDDTTVGDGLSTSDDQKSVNMYDIFMKLPHSDLQNLCSLLGHEGLSDKVYLLAGEVLKKLASAAPSHRKFFILELSDLAYSLSGSAIRELITLRNTNMLGLSAGSMAGAAVLRILQTLSSLTVPDIDVGNSKNDDNQEHVTMWKLNNSLEPLWQELSECISVTETQLAQGSFSSVISDSNTGEHVPGAGAGAGASSLSPLPPGTQRLLPFIESFLVLCEKLQANNSNLQQDDAYATAREVKEFSGNSSPGGTGIDGAVTFSRFAEKHRRLLNAFVRQNPGLLEKSLSMMLKAPRLIDFDNKRLYFRSRIRQQHDQHLTGPLRISVRRAYVLEDSYNQLRMRPTQDLKGRLNVHFQGEEGIDAGGLTREWYQLLSRVIFDKGALLFTTGGNNATFQPNPNSVYQTEHLSYFKFVGRVVAKALFDGQLLDVYFTRSFYKHILGVKVTYHDIEAVDPDYYKNLKWLLENDVSDILDLTFSMDADEEKHILYEKTEVTDYELKPGGRNIRVTEETKHEYVDLVAEHILTNAIRPQINSFLEGFNELIPRDLISIFNDKELELLISGLPEIDLDDLKANTEYTGYTIGSSVVLWFWEVVKAFNKEDRARMLQFVTGTSKVPLEGFKALQGISGPQRFQIHKAYGAPERLPSAHTCFNQLDLPEYTSKEQLQERLLLAIHEASEGFGFG
ncbi:hypothetical protein L1987_02463 [Smallanthus sonchifolius]|uniref:Uncharacterized protein n=2 Tax=Smallanthus sonchifolius TaxID=185202 RepID=A0ACB9K7U0_9ASTR|nr:hypothetical protein L1987_02462 [Smallanthus sonchifolius]KAI3828363.1 hypothetical protein L1987_02463 [Smallanthus sonchifolius]